MQSEKKYPSQNPRQCCCLANRGEKNTRDIYYTGQTNQYNKKKSDNRKNEGLNLQKKIRKRILQLTDIIAGEDVSRKTI